MKKLLGNSGSMISDYVTRKSVTVIMFLATLLLCHMFLLQQYIKTAEASTLDTCLAVSDDMIYEPSDLSKDLLERYQLNYLEDPMRQVTKGEFMQVVLKVVQNSLENSLEVQDNTISSAPDENALSTPDNTTSSALDENVSSTLDENVSSTLDEDALFVPDETVDCKDSDVISFNLEKSKVLKCLSVLSEYRNEYMQPITRAETAEMLSIMNSLFFKIPAQEEVNDFEDIKGEWCEEVVNEITSILLMNRTSDFTFSPQECLSIEEVLQILENVKSKTEDIIINDSDIVNAMTSTFKMSLKKTKDMVTLELDSAKLPTNYKDYPYILKGVDKRIYELPFTIDVYRNYVLPAELYDYAKIHYSEIERMANQYMDTILNIDYTNFDEESFKQGLKKDSLMPLVYVVVKDYLDYVQSNQIKMEGECHVIPSTLYYDGMMYRVRALVKLHVIHAKDPTNLFFGDRGSGFQIPYNGEYITRVVDIPLSRYINTLTYGIYVSRIYPVSLYFE